LLPNPVAVCCEHFCLLVGLPKRFLLVHGRTLVVAHLLVQRRTEKHRLALPKFAGCGSISFFEDWCRLLYMPTGFATTKQLLF
jgi:hypothetical protein